MASRALAVEYGDLRQTAGFFEGEGCVNLGQTRTAFRCQVLLTNTHVPTLEWFQSLWGGRIYAETKVNESGKARTWSNLVFNRVEAERLLPAIRPYLRIKADQVDNVLEFLKVLAEGRAFRGGRRPKIIEAKLTRLVQRHRDLSTQHGIEAAREPVMPDDQPSDQQLTLTEVFSFEP